jgi:hypothetical protein
MSTTTLSKAEVTKSEKEIVGVFLTELIAREREISADQISEKIVKALDELYHSKRNVTAFDVYNKLVSLDVIKDKHHIKFSENAWESDKPL